MLRQYEAGQVTVSWYDIDLSSGWAEDTFLTIEPLSAQVETTFGADGQMCPSKMSNKGATITLTLQQTADANKAIADRMQTQDEIGGIIPVAPFKVVDEVGDSAHFVALNAILTEKPGHSFGNTSGEKAWVWVCESYIETKDPATVTEALDKFLRGII